MKKSRGSKNEDVYGLVHDHGGVPVCMSMITGNILRNIALPNPPMVLARSTSVLRTFPPSAKEKRGEINPFKFINEEFPFQRPYNKTGEPQKNSKKNKIKVYWVQDENKLFKVDQQEYYDCCK